METFDSHREEPKEGKMQRQPPWGQRGPLAGCPWCFWVHKLPWVRFGRATPCSCCLRRTFCGSFIHLSATEAGIWGESRRWDLGSYSSTLQLFVHGISHAFSITNSRLYSVG